MLSQQVRKIDISYRFDVELDELDGLSDEEIAIVEESVG